MKNCTFKHSLAALDLFPASVPGFNVRGKESVTTIVGSIVSILVFLIVVFYGANKLTFLIERRNPQISSFIERGAVTKHDETNLMNANIKFAFGIEGFLDKKLKNDPAYVKWIVRQVRRIDGVETEKFLPYHICTDEDYDSFPPPADNSLYALN